jgi:hypothetical protein
MNNLETQTTYLPFVVIISPMKASVERVITALEVIGVPGIFSCHEIKDINRFYFLCYNTVVIDVVDKGIPLCFWDAKIPHLRQKYAQLFQDRYIRLVDSDSFLFSELCDTLQTAIDGIDSPN